MKIVFNICTKVEFSDVEKIPVVGEVEKAFIELITDTGAIVHNLSITNYEVIKEVIKEVSGKECYNDFNNINQT